MISNRDKEYLLGLIKEKALFYQRIKLSSGKQSGYYIDARQISLSGEGAYLIAKTVFNLIKEDNIQAIGGPTVGADPIVGAVACFSELQKTPLQAFIVRKEPKKHGMQRYIEGPPLKKGMRVAIIDDVVTTGESVIRAANVAQELGCEVVKLIALIDRLEGAEERLKQLGFTLTRVFTRDDLGITPVS
ncbi:orotate phosphoribosyltransferase [Candidatus Aerophobetes bacterium]|nr:orotate phosphoribosyltransferase [Candidatus Aerophobetes bacterium]